MSGVATYVTADELERLCAEYGVPIEINPDRGVARLTLGNRVYLTRLEATS